MPSLAFTSRFLGFFKNKYNGVVRGNKAISIGHTLFSLLKVK